MKGVWIILLSFKREKGGWINEIQNPQWAYGDEAGHDAVQIVGKKHAIITFIGLTLTKLSSTLGWRSRKGYWSAGNSTHSWSKAHTTAGERRNMSRLLAGRRKKQPAEANISWELCHSPVREVPTWTLSYM